MFSRKKKNSRIDPEQLELIENAQARIRQKRKLYYHFIFFIVGSIVLVVVNLLMGYGKGTTFFGYDWFLAAMILWAMILLIHLFRVHVTDRFMGRAWERRQLQKLVAKQQARIKQMETEMKNDEILMIESEPPRVLEDSALSESGKVLTIIAAVGKNNELGKDNALIWHLPDDLRHFKRLTNGHHVIMGRKTFESMPKALPTRINVVITRQLDYTTKDAVVVKDLSEALEVASADPQPFIIGGGQIYEQALDKVGRIELTRVHRSFEADTYFPKLDGSVWKEVWSEFHPKDDRHPFDFTFLRYERQQ